MNNLRQCTADLEFYPPEYFYVDKSRPDGLKNRCIVCERNRIPSILKRQTGVKKASPEIILERKSKSCKIYEKTRKGHLMRTYRNMKSRVEGIQKKNLKQYLGLPILEKTLFYNWALSDLAYNSLYDSWVVAEYTLKLTPSIDRIDSTKGYIEGNIRWLTQSQNSGRLKQ